MSCSEPPPETDVRMSPLPPSDHFHDDAEDIKLTSPECNMGRSLTYLGTFLGVLCAVGGVAATTFVLTGGGRVKAAADMVADLDRADSDINAEAISNGDVDLKSPKRPEQRRAWKGWKGTTHHISGASTIDSQTEYDDDDDDNNMAYNDADDLPSAYEMRRYADELMRHSNEFAIFRKTETSFPPTAGASLKGSVVTKSSPLTRRGKPEVTATASKRPDEVTPSELYRKLSTTSGKRTVSLPPSDGVLSKRPRAGNKETTATSYARRGRGGVKSIESGGVDTGVAGTRGSPPAGLMALPVPTKVYGPGPRPLLCQVQGGGARAGPPLHECSHLILGDHVLDLLQRVIRPAGRATRAHGPGALTAAAVAEQVRALRSLAAPGIRLIVGLRALDVENSYLRLWSNRSSLAASVNLAYEWVSRAGLDGIALTNLVVGRHTINIYAEFLKRLRALFREDYLIVFGFFHREHHVHDYDYTENVLRSIVRLCTFAIFEAHDVRPRPCRSFVVNALDGYRNAISNDTIVSSLNKIRRLALPRDQTCVSMGLGVIRFLLYDRPRRLGQVCHNYFAEAYSTHCREWTEIRFEHGALANTALVHRRAMAVAEIMDSFDNETTIAAKVWAALFHWNAACLALYNVELDDAGGACDSQTPYARLSAVATVMRQFTTTRQTRAATTTSATSPSTTISQTRARVLKRASVRVRRRRHH